MFLEESQLVIASGLTLPLTLSFVIFLFKIIHIKSTQKKKKNVTKSHQITIFDIHAKFNNSHDCKNTMTIDDKPHVWFCVCFFLVYCTANQHKFLHYIYTHIFIVFEEHHH